MTAAVAQRPVQVRRAAGARTAPRPRPGVRRRNVALRRRIAALVTIGLLVLALGTTWAMTSEASSEITVLEATVVVGAGETVWDIANDYLPEGAHPQAYVADVLRYNDVEASAVQPGTVLRLPRR